MQWKLTLERMTICIPIPTDIEHKQDGIEFNQEGINADQVNDDVSLIELFTHDQITEQV
jgi:hypothetical protein